MTKIKQQTFQIIGVVGVLFLVVVFALRPSYPTPDKLLVLLFFIFLIFHQASEMLKRLLPFVAAILVYESFRSVADNLNSHVNYSLAPAADKLLFGNLPTVYLQNWLWHGDVRWYDFVLYAPYLLFFVLPFGLAILIWKTRERHYWRAVSTYLVVFFASFLTFWLFPAAPPWLASDNHIIQPITRISSDVWLAFGLRDFPSFYSQISPNPVAAVPSLHAAAATLFSLFIFKLFGRRWGVLSLIYPALLFAGIVYQGEHYAFDVIVGIIYAFVGYWLTPLVVRWFRMLYTKSELFRYRA